MFIGCGVADFEEVESEAIFGGEFLFEEQDFDEDHFFRDVEAFEKIFELREEIGLDDHDDRAGFGVYDEVFAVSAGVGFIGSSRSY